MLRAATRSDSTSRYVAAGTTYFQAHYDGVPAVGWRRRQQPRPWHPTRSGDATSSSSKTPRRPSQIARGSCFAGEATQGRPLTAYGFSLFGDKGATAALACFIIAIVTAVGAAVSLGLGLRMDPGRSVQGVKVGPSEAVPVPG